MALAEQRGLASSTARLIYPRVRSVPTDCSLQTIALKRPAADDALLAISGIGPPFVERHAEVVLAVTAGAD